MQNSVIEGSLPPYLRLVRTLAHSWPLPRGKGRFVNFLTRKYADWPASVRLQVDEGFTIHADLRDPMFRSLFFFGNYEPEVTEIFKSILRPGDNVIDAGTNFGYFSLLASRGAGAKGRVDSFEPMPKMAEVLRKNLEANRATNVKVNVCALGSAPGEAIIHIPEGLPSGHASLAKVNWENETQVACRIITLDSYLSDNNITRVDVLKMDVEGSEKSALEGASKLLSSAEAPIIIVEANYETAAAFGYEPSALVSLLREHNKYEFIQTLKDGLHALPASGKPEHGSNLLCYLPDRHSERVEKLLKRVA